MFNYDWKKSKQSYHAYVTTQANLPKYIIKRYVFNNHLNLLYIMARKENNHDKDHSPVLEPDSKTVGDISIMRNILMGQQMAEYQQQFDHLNNRLDLMEAAFNRELANLNNASNNRSDELANEMNSNFKKLEKLITDNIKSLDKKLEKVSNEDKKRLGKMMGDLSKKLIGE